ncbi:MAG: ribokinase [Planctomycetes bacterium]|nr:ribokinase [Planctomycetota bacterium]
MAVEPVILVVGSVNMDLVVRSQHMPTPGETVLGDNFKTSPGGKGANQAVAVARLGGNCRMIGRVGDDSFGKDLLGNLKFEGVDCEGIQITPDAPSGTAMIIVDARGENSIVVASGANFMVTPDDVYSREEMFKQAAIVLLQLELPVTAVRAAIDLARKHGKKVILDPAPAIKQFPPELYQVDIISPNVSEAEILTGKKAVETKADKMAASDLIARGAKAAVLKLGQRGSLVVTSDGHFYTVGPFYVNVIDTTAAGDAFTAALALSVARGHDLRSAARIANAAGALACTKFGAQSAMPTAYEVKVLMADQKND